MLDILLYLEPTKGVTMVGPAEKIQNKDSQMAGKGNFAIGFATTVNTSFNYVVSAVVKVLCSFQPFKDYLVLKIK